jgi:hypothetical protein
MLASDGGPAATAAEPARRPPRYWLSPSALGSFFHFDCERFLHLKTDKEARALLLAESPPPDSATGSPQLQHHQHLQDAVFQKGFRWEEVLNGMIRQQGYTLFDLLTQAREAHPQDDEAFNALHLQTSTDMLRNAAVGTVIYQARLQPPEHFYRNTPELSRHGIALTACFPDYVRVDSVTDPATGVPRRVLTVIDAKHSPRVKLSHKVQVALYTLLLTDMGLEVSARGGVWRPGRQRPQVRASCRGGPL